VYLRRTFDISLKFNRTARCVALAENENAIKIGLKFTESECQRPLDDDSFITDFLAKHFGHVVSESGLVARYLLSVSCACKC
jgi:hypothetical protein